MKFSKTVTPRDQDPEITLGSVSGLIGDYIDTTQLGDSDRTFTIDWNAAPEDRTIEAKLELLETWAQGKIHQNCCEDNKGGCFVTSLGIHYDLGVFPVSEWRETRWRRLGKGSDI